MTQHIIVVSDEILELIAETIAEHSSCSECQPQERLHIIHEDTPQIIQISPRIMDRYTVSHIEYYSITVGE